MVWRETRAVDERMRFVLAVEAARSRWRRCARRFGISRRAGYKWLSRYRDAGVAGLEDRSRAPLHHPQAVAAAIVERCLAVRRAHPTWGPVKVRAWLERRQPEVGWPAASTIGALFDREGLTVKRRRRRRGPPASAPFAACGAANDVWCIDFKGWFLTGDGSRRPTSRRRAADPERRHRRYLLRCQAVGRTDTEHVWPILDAAVRESGLPLVLRSDNGPPFASTGAGGLSRLAVLVLKAGVRPERIAQALAGEPVGLAETADGPMAVRYGPIELGVIDHRADRLRQPQRPARGLVDDPRRSPTIPPAPPQPCP